MKLIFAFVLALLLSGCAYDEYRYPCQNPVNWENAECKSPICDASSTCPDDLLPPKEIEGVEESPCVEKE